jgi:hypothetical protein
MPSFFARVMGSTGPEKGSPGAAIQEHYMAAIRAGQKRDAQAQLAARTAMLEAAKAAGYLEVVAAMNRYRLSLGDESMEPPELAVKAVTLAVDALPFRPRPGGPEAGLLNAWAEWDIAVRNVSGDVGQKEEAFTNAVRVARAERVLVVLTGLSQAPNAQAFAVLFGTIGLRVYKAAYRRDPPSNEAFLGGPTRLAGLAPGQAPSAERQQRMFDEYLAQRAVERQEASVRVAAARQEPWFADAVVDMDEVAKRKMEEEGPFSIDPGIMVPNPYFVLPLPKLVEWGFSTDAEVREAVRLGNLPWPPVGWRSPLYLHVLHLMGWSEAEAYARIGLWAWSSEDARQALEAQPPLE